MTLGAAVRRSVPRRGWAGAGDVLLVVLVTALQVAGPRSGSPGNVPDLLAGVAGDTLGAAAALIGGMVLVWRRSRPVGVLVVCVAAYAVNAAVVPGVPPYGVGRAICRGCLLPRVAPGGMRGGGRGGRPRARLRDLRPSWRRG